MTPQEVADAEEEADAAKQEQVDARESWMDLRAAWIDYEQMDSFRLTIEVHDLPDGWGIPDEPSEASPFLGEAKENASMAAEQAPPVWLVAGFTVGGQNYRAVVGLASDAEGELVPLYTLIPEGSEPENLTGMVDTANDRVHVFILKSQVGSPADGDALSKFYSYSRMADLIVDFAPDAEYLVGEPDPEALLEDPTGIGAPESPVDPENPAAEPELPGHVELAYGRDYAFGQYPNADAPRPTPASGSPASGESTPPNLVVTVDELSKAVAPGSTVTYQILVRNAAPARDEVVFGLNSAAAGWAHELQGAQQGMSLAAGQTGELTLVVTAGEDAQNTHRSLLRVSSDLGHSSTASMLTIADADAMAPGEPDAQLQEDSGDEGGASPGAGVLLAAVAAMAGMWAARRGRR